MILSKQFLLCLLGFFELCGELFGEGVKLCDAKLGKPLEGHGPEDACKEDDEEITDNTACVCVACAEGGKRRGKSRLDGENYAKSHCQLDNLGIPGGARFKLGKFTVDYIGRYKTYGATQKGASVFETALIVMRIQSFVTGDGNYKNEEYKRKDNTRHYYYGHEFMEFLVACEYRAKNKNESEGKQERYHNVKKRVNAEIHSGECYQKDNHRTDKRLFPVGIICSHRAQSACYILSMSRGEGIARRGNLGIANNLKGGVVNPRARDTEDKLCALVENRAKETCYKHEISFSLVHAPEY